MTCKHVDLGKWLLFLNQIFVQAFWGGLDYQMLNYILEEFPTGGNWSGWNLHK